MPNTDWTRKTLNMDRVFYQLSDASIFELNRFMSETDLRGRVDQVTVDFDHFHSLILDVEKLRKEVDDGQKFVIVKRIDGFTPVKTEAMHWILSVLLGETIVQNEEGQHLIHIYDRDPKRRIKDGARYHQTHESGQIHTDNVNIPENYQYLLVGCAAPAKVGGENIIVNGRAIYDFLNAHAREELEILKSNFVFEYRGISRELYEAPIITFSERGEPLFRHLRTYMESAHNRAKRPLSEDQVRALDTLDAALSMSEFQLLYRLNSGEILVANDSQVLHDRRCFVDGKDMVILDDLKKHPEKHSEKHIETKSTLKRTLLRTWVRKVR